MRIYLAGPMTGIPKMNFPAFDAAAEDLRARGYDVVSPAELDDPEDRAEALASTDGQLKQGGKTWGLFLARDVQLIADGGVEAIVCLPGWTGSRGARLETFVGRLCGLPIVDYASGELFSVWREDIIAAHGVEGPHRIERIEPRYDEPTLTDREDGGFFGTGGRMKVTINGRPLGEWTAYSGETRVTNATTGGEKGAKPERMSLLPWDVLMRDVAPLYAKGAEKYAPNNWRKGYDWSLSFDALGRHLAQFHGGQWLDDETQAPHLASVVFHACALLYFHGAHPDLNDLTLED